MLRTMILAFWLATGLIALPTAALSAPPGPGDLTRSIETSRAHIANFQATIHEYDDEMRKTVANDPAARKRRTEIRIIKRYYSQQIEALKAKIIDDYKKLQEYRSRGDQ